MRRDCLIFLCTRRAETSLDSEFHARPRRDRESRCLFLRDWYENHLLINKMNEFWLYHFLKLDIQINNWSKWDETVWKFFIQDETETRHVPKFCTRPRVLVPLVSRPRRDRDSRSSLKLTRLWKAWNILISFIMLTHKFTVSFISFCTLFILFPNSYKAWLHTPLCIHVQFEIPLGCVEIKISTPSKVKAL